MSTEKSTNIKVGITVTVFSVILMLMVLWLSQYNPYKKSYTIEGNFYNVGGLTVGSKVYLMGVSVGKVLTVTPVKNKVSVIMEIESEIKIPTNTILNITSKGIVGDKCVEFFATSVEETEKFYEPGAVISGNSPVGMEDIMNEAKKALQKTTGLVGAVTKDLNEIFGQINKLSKSINKITDSTKGFVDDSNKAVNNVNKFVDEINKITFSNSDEISDIIGNVNKISKSLEQTASSLNSILENPENRKDLQFTVKSIKKTTEDIQKISNSAKKLMESADLISKDVRDVSGDLGFKNDIKDIIKNIRTISTTFANTLSSPNGGDKNKEQEKDKKLRLNFDFRSELFSKINYQFKSDKPVTFDVIGNFNLLAHTGVERFPFIQLGIEEIGSGNQFNLQAGFYPIQNLRVRLGLIRGKLGVGSNYFIDQSKTEIIAETYDISTPHVRLGVLQSIYGDYGLSFYWDNLFITNTNEFNLGVRWQPGLF